MQQDGGSFLQILCHVVSQRLTDISEVVITASIISAISHRTDERDTKHLQNISQLLWDYIVQYTRRPSSSVYCIFNTGCTRVLFTGIQCIGGQSIANSELHNKNRKLDWWMSDAQLSPWVRVQKQQQLSFGEQHTVRGGCFTKCLKARQKFTTYLSTKSQDHSFE